MAEATDTTADRVLEGFIIRYNSLATPWQLKGGKVLTERFLPGAFSESVAAINRGEYRIKVNVEHMRDNALMQLGVTQDNVTLEDRPEGVYMRMVLGGTSISNDTYEVVKREWANGLSIEANNYPGEEPAYQSFGADYVRTFARARLEGFAITANPRYPDARVFARSANDDELARLEREVAAYDQRKIYELEAYLYGVRL
jgi:HK97 family phage prohead protease